MEKLERGLKKFGIKFNRKQQEKFVLYQKEIIAWNRKVNLISKKDENRIVTHHFLDSACCLRYFPQKALVIADVGSGAGLPGIPIKILRPDLKITLIESKRKKIYFLKSVVEKLSLVNINIICERAENIKTQYDIVVTRELMKLKKSLKICLPLLKEGGLFINFKGGDITSELKEAERILKKLGGCIKCVEKVKLPFTNKERKLVLIHKCFT